MPFLKCAVALTAIVLFGLWYHDLTKDAPDPRVQCDARATEAERDQCRDIIDFAMSAGW